MAWWRVQASVDELQDACMSELGGASFVPLFDVTHTVLMSMTDVHTSIR